MRRMWGMPAVLPIRIGESTTSFCSVSANARCSEGERDWEYEWDFERERRSFLRSHLSTFSFCFLV